MLGLKTMQAKRELKRLVRGYLDNAGIPITLGCLTLDGVVAELREEALEAATQRIVELQEKEKGGENDDKPEGTRDLEENRGDDGSNDRAHEG